MGKGISSGSVPKSCAGGTRSNSPPCDEQFEGRRTGKNAPESLHVGTMLLGEATTYPNITHVVAPFVEL